MAVLIRVRIWWIKAQMLCSAKFGTAWAMSVATPPQSPAVMMPGSRGIKISPTTLSAFRIVYLFMVFSPQDRRPDGPR